MTHADWLILGYVSALFFMLAFRYQFKQSDITYNTKNNNNSYREEYTLRR